MISTTLISIEPGSMKIKIQDQYGSEIHSVRTEDYKNFLNIARSSGTRGELRAKLRFGS